MPNKTSLRYWVIMVVLTVILAMFMETTFVIILIGEVIAFEVFMCFNIKFRLLNWVIFLFLISGPFYFGMKFGLVPFLILVVAIINDRFDKASWSEVFSEKIQIQPNKLSKEKSA